MTKRIGAQIVEVLANCTALNDGATRYNRNLLPLRIKQLSVYIPAEETTVSLFFATCRGVYACEMNSRKFAGGDA
jgi:hypothetical protein